ncbi:MAG: NCS2 family permease [Spirochaetes bacterium]|nr:NCS2 family permease [Spirochaetota bacterium]
MNILIEKYFNINNTNTTITTEIRAGIATFLTMAYIIVVNPLILQDAGMPFHGVLFATVIVSCISSVLMGLVTNLPFALAPGMGINAFFTYTLVGSGTPWQVALGAVCISGIIFMLLSSFGIREKIVGAIPLHLRYAVAAGIGIFLGFIGLKNAGIVVSHPATLVTFGGMGIQQLLFACGLIVTGILVYRKIKGALIIGIVATASITWISSHAFALFGHTPFATLPSKYIAFPDSSLFFSFNIRDALSVSLVAPIFTLLFTDMFDSISTFVGVAQVGGFIDTKTGLPHNVGRALFVDGFATFISGIFGTSSATTYIESAAGVEEGGKTGLTAVVAGLLFLPFMWLSPLLSFIPPVATAPVLVLIGLFMMQPLSHINWKDISQSLPAFVTCLMIPLTYSITQGIVWGFLSYTFICIAAGKWKELSPTLIIIDICAVIALLV